MVKLIVADAKFAVLWTRTIVPAPSTVKSDVPALAEFAKLVTPPLLNENTALPDVELLRNEYPALENVAAKVCALEELLTIPTPSNDMP